MEPYLKRKKKNTDNSESSVFVEEVTYIVRRRGLQAQLRGRSGSRSGSWGENFTPLHKKEGKEPGAIRSHQGR